MTPELRARGLAAWQAEARRLHALADRWLTDCDLEEARTARRAAHRAECIAKQWKLIQPAGVPTASTEGDDHGPPN